MQMHKQSLAWRIRDLMGLEASHQDAIQTIKDALPDKYEANVSPVFYTIRKIKAVDQPEVAKMVNFESSKCFGGCLREN